MSDADALSSPAASPACDRGTSAAKERRHHSFVDPDPKKETNMDREHVKGTADKAKGAIKEGAGKLTGDKSMETEGKMDKAKGAAHNAAGDVKDAARDAADAVRK
jgi:uncharacterized protein YjbJ (UPF0337 family)